MANIENFIVLIATLFFLSIVALAIVMFVFADNLVIVDTEYKPVKVVIKDTEYNQLTPTISQCNTIVEYNNVQYSFDDFDTFNKYKNKLSQTTLGVLKICTYNDGSIKYSVVGLE